MSFENEKIENNCIKSMSNKYPVGAINGKVNQGANTEFVIIKAHKCIYVPIFL